MSDPALQVLITNEQTLEVDEDRILDVARRTAAREGAVGELSIALVDRERISRLNEEHLLQVGPTDVLSFPVDGLVRVLPPDAPPVLIGEVVVCPEVAVTQSEDLAGELDLLVAHGVLHLLGFEHETEEGAEQMRQREFASTGRAGARAS